MDTLSNHFLYNRNEIYTDFNDSDNKVGYVIPSQSPSGKLMSISLQRQSFLREITSTINVVNIKSGGMGKRRNLALIAELQLPLFFKVLSLQDYFAITMDNIK